jgi:hypothetical protein
LVIIDWLGEEGATGFACGGRGGTAFSITSIVSYHASEVKG